MEQAAGVAARRGCRGLSEERSADDNLVGTVRERGGFVGATSLDDAVPLG